MLHQTHRLGLESVKEVLHLLLAVCPQVEGGRVQLASVGEDQEALQVPDGRVLEQSALGIDDCLV